MGIVKDARAEHIELLLSVVDGAAIEAVSMLLPRVKEEILEAGLVRFLVKALEVLLRRRNLLHGVILIRTIRAHGSRWGSF